MGVTLPELDKTRNSHLARLSPPVGRTPAATSRLAFQSAVGTGCWPETQVSLWASSTCRSPYHHHQDTSIRSHSSWPRAQTSPSLHTPLLGPHPAARSLLPHFPRRQGLWAGLDLRLRAPCPALPPVPLSPRARGQHHGCSSRDRSLPTDRTPRRGST